MFKLRNIFVVSALMYSSIIAGTFSELKVSTAENGDSIHLAGDQMLVLQLKCAVSGGYSWQCTGASPDILNDVSGKHGIGNGPEFSDIDHNNGKFYIGVAKAHVLRFTGQTTGWCELKAVECRRWEKNKAPVDSFHIFVHVDAPFSGSYAIPTASTNSSVPLILPKAKAQNPSATQLPTRFNWVDSGIVTPIKDQGQTGCCWAFSASGVFESQIMRFGGRASGDWVDCAEQYLVSCNPWGMSNNGGWFPYPMGTDYIASDCGQTAAGAVYEADLPFNATDPNSVIVSTPLPHHEKFKVWGYCDGVVDSAWPKGIHRATDDQIKNAIYKYGPIGASVKASPNWDSYTGGVSAYTISDNSVDHIIMITGWNDDSSCYYVKNSWGTWWGENGYIRVAYGTSNIELYPTWISWNDTATGPSLTIKSPNGIGYNIGQIVPITWTTNQTGTVTAQLLKNGTVVKSLGTASATSNLSWTVGNDVGSGNGYTVKLTLASLTSSSGSFAIFPPLVRLPQKYITVNSYDSQNSTNEAATNTLDGDTTTIWHTDYTVSTPNYPHYIVYKIGTGSVTVSNMLAFSYKPRNDGGTNGDVKAYELLVSPDGTNWTKADSGSLPGTSGEDTIMFNSPVAGANAIYVKFLGLSEQNGNPWASMAEFNLFCDNYDTTQQGLKSKTGLFNASSVAAIGSALRINLPVSDIFTLKIFDLKGAMVLEKHLYLSAGSSQIDLSGNGLASKSYIARLDAQNVHLTTKVIFNKP